MSDHVHYTDPDSIQGVRVTETPRSGLTVSGYGTKIPTRWMLRCANVWRRVYIVNYGNAGSPYILVAGVRHFLDTDTAHRCEVARAD